MLTVQSVSDTNELTLSAEMMGTRHVRAMSAKAVFDKNYIVPKYSWSKSKMAISWKQQQEQRFGYVALIGEESKPFQNLTKIFVQKKSEKKPSMTSYNMMKDWSKELAKNVKKGQFLKSERLTPAQETALKAKNEKLPGPGTYNWNKPARVLGAFNMSTEQLQMFGNQKYYSMQTPSAIYTPDAWVSPL